MPSHGSFLLSSETAKSRQAESQRQSSISQHPGPFLPALPVLWKGRGLISTHRGANDTGLFFRVPVTELSPSLPCIPLSCVTGIGTAGAVLLLLLWVEKLLEPSFPHPVPCWGDCPSQEPRDSASRQRVPAAESCPR